MCAGLLVGHVLAEVGSAELTDAALAALRVGEYYAERLDRLALESEWGRHLARAGAGRRPRGVPAPRHVIPGAGVRAGVIVPGLRRGPSPARRRRSARDERAHRADAVRASLLVPFIIVFLISSDRVHVLIAAVIFIAASLTDWLDGRMARRWNQVTRLGTLLDPVADKVLVAAALVALVQIDMVDAWVAVVIIGRELAVTGLRGVALSMGAVVAASGFGKAKTVSQYVMITVLILEKGVPGEFMPFHLVSTRHRVGDARLHGAVGRRLLLSLLSEHRVQGARQGSGALAVSLLGLCAAYLIGAIPVGYVVARLRGGVDIRARGQRKYRRHERAEDARQGAGHRDARSVTSSRVSRR